MSKKARGKADTIDLKGRNHGDTAREDRQDEIRKTPTAPAREATAWAAIPPKEIPISTAPGWIGFSANRAEVNSSQFRPGSAGQRIHSTSWPGKSWYGARDASAPTPGKK
jgi:hypothetical protein